MSTATVATFFSALAGVMVNYRAWKTALANAEQRGNATEIVSFFYEYLFFKVLIWSNATQCNARQNCTACEQEVERLKAQIRQLGGTI
jgi:hypothetical protein